MDRRPEDRAGAGGVCAVTRLRATTSIRVLPLTLFVDDALDELEFVTGSTKTKWGAVRAKLGHPAPFPLQYVEVGNEDQFDRSGSYEGRLRAVLQGHQGKVSQARDHRHGAGEERHAGPT